MVKTFLCFDIYSNSTYNNLLSCRLKINVFSISVRSLIFKSYFIIYIRGYDSINH